MRIAVMDMYSDPRQDELSANVPLLCARTCSYNNCTTEDMPLILPQYQIHCLLLPWPGSTPGRSLVVLLEELYQENGCTSPDKGFVKQ